MEKNFHYHVTYTAAVLAGFSSEDGQKIARAAQYVDECEETVQSTVTLVWKNLLDTFPVNQPMRDVLNIWPVFHFLPGDYSNIQNEVDPLLRNSTQLVHNLAAKLICTPESQLVRKMVEETKDVLNYSDIDMEAKLQRIGISMHVLADTFAHQGFAGIPLACINEVNKVREEKPDDTFGKKWYLPLDYSPALSQNSFGYLGHGRIGHIVDQPGACIAYQAAWKDPAKDNWIARYNPMEFYCAFLQMRKAMEYIRGIRQSLSHKLERPEMLDQRQGQWATTERFLRALENADTDTGLPDFWYPVVSLERPKHEYVPYNQQGEKELIKSFKAAAQAHRKMVLDECRPLGEYLDLYP